MHFFTLELQYREHSKVIHAADSRTAPWRTVAVEDVSSSLQVLIFHIANFQ